MMMILSQPCWVSNIYGLTYKIRLCSASSSATHLFSKLP
jgi:hypothetical protein